MTICESLSFTQFCRALQPLQIFWMRVASSSSRSLRQSSSWSTTAKLLIKILVFPNAYSFALIGSSRSKYVTPWKNEIFIEGELKVFLPFGAYPFFPSSVGCHIVLPLQQAHATVAKCGGTAFWTCVGRCRTARDMWTHSSSAVPAPLD